MNRVFYTVLVAQFLSALADNALLFAAIGLLMFYGMPDWHHPLLQSVFVVAYIVLAPFVGPFADALPKGRVLFIGNAIKFMGSAPSPARASRPVIPGERQFRDGDRVRHARWGDGIVVTSKLTRSDEEITVAFKDASVGRKTMLASLANLEIVG